MMSRIVLWLGVDLFGGRDHLDAQWTGVTIDINSGW